MSQLYKPCYNQSSHMPCYKIASNQPIYKVEAGDWTQVSFAWGSDGRDLDICAYWEDLPDKKGGWDYDTSGTDIGEGAYHLICSSDVQTEEGSEWCKIKMEPWNNGGRRTFKIHFHYFPWDSKHPSTSCTVIASQFGGETKIKRGQSCNNDGVQRAAIGGSGPDADPYCIVSFDETGKLIGVQ